MDYIFFGIQGSGKGTQGKILAQKHGLEYFGAGNELRKLAEEDSELGNKVKKITEAGQLVSIETIIEIIGNFIKKIPQNKGVVFDGIPRNNEQRVLFEELMNKLDKKPTALFIKISEEEAIHRITNRWMSKSTNKIYMSKDLALQECSRDDIYQRADDNEESIKVRINAYKKETIPVIDWYREQGRLIEVNGTPPIEEVAELVNKSLAK